MAHKIANCCSNSTDSNDFKDWPVMQTTRPPVNCHPYIELDEDGTKHSLMKMLQFNDIIYIY
jgi:hypothetical protein